MSLSSLGKGGAKLEFPSPKETMGKVWLKLSHWLSKRENLFKNSQCIFTISILSPLGKGCIGEQTWIYFTPKCFVPCLVEIGPVVLDNKFKFISLLSSPRVWCFISPLPKDMPCAKLSWNWPRVRKFSVLLLILI